MVLNQKTLNTTVYPAGPLYGVVLGKRQVVAVEVDKITDVDTFLSANDDGTEMLDCVYSLTTGKLYAGELGHYETEEAVAAEMLGDAKRMGEIQDTSVRFGTTSTPTPGVFVNPLTCGFPVEGEEPTQEEMTIIMNNMYRAFDKLIHLGLPKNTKFYLGYDEEPYYKEYGTIG